MRRGRLTKKMTIIAFPCLLSYGKVWMKFTLFNRPDNLRVIIKNDSTGEVNIYPRNKRGTEHYER